jgi:uncharacterized membrane protein YoaK (UPF0700 family)
MFAHQSNEEFSRAVTFKWFLLAFAAGSVNAGGYLACHRFVTHVTGFATLFGLEMAKLDFEQALPILTVPFFFVVGAMTSAFFIDVQLARQRPARYGLMLGLVAFLLATAAVGGYFNAFGLFGARYQVEHDYPLLVLLCFASGLQNATISTASGMVVRTTHLTGLTTDLGTGLVRVAFGNLSGRQLRRELKRTWLRLGTIGSFGLGGIAGALLFRQVHYFGFLLPAVICVYVGWVATRARRRLQLHNEAAAQRAAKAEADRWVS